MGYKLKRATIWRDTTRLPSEYQEVEYIQSSGTQYINTGWTPTIYDTIETKFQTQASASDTNLYGSRYNQRTGVRQDMSVRINTSSGKGIAVHYPISGVSSGLTDTGWFFTSDIINTPRVLKVTPQYCYVDGSIKYTFNVTRSEYTGDLSAYIFGKHEVGDYGDGSKLGKFTVYSFKIWTNDVLVRDFVPCYRKSDGVIGLYDLVNSQFYTNSGTGTFTKGNDVGGLQEKQVRPSGLPAEYQEVEYIQSSGTQSINTGVYMNPNYTVEVKYQLATFNSNYQTIFGCRRGNYEKFVARFRKSDGTLGLQRAKNATAAGENKGDYSGYYDSNIHTIKMNMYGYMDDTLLCTFSSSTFTGHFSITLYLFALNASELSSPIVDLAEMKLYSAKIYDTDGTTLIRNFVPCYRKSDNVIGLYDLATNTFFTNAGTGTFTKGGDV